MKTPTRDCLRGHGPMSLVDGLFAVPQMTPNPTNALAGLLSTGEPQIVGTGKVYSFRLYVCNTCGALELVDSEKV